VVTLLQEWDMPLTVLAMVLATLLMASLVHRYQLHLASVQSRVRRLAAGAAQIEHALAGLRSVPLSRELRITLRGDVLARYQRIRRLYKRYPGLAERLRSAESALHSEGASSGRGVGPIEDDEAFRRIIVSLDRLLDAVAPGGLLQTLPGDVREIFRRELGERRAEAMSRFHLVKAKRLEAAGTMTRARSHLTTLLHVLRERGPSTDFVRELHAEAAAALSALGKSRATEDSPAEAPPRNMALARRLAG
jgi:hypothetical protein